MKLNLKSSNGAVLGMLVVAGVGIAFWMLGLSPKRERAAELGRQVEGLESSISTHQAEVLQGEEARRQFDARWAGTDLKLRIEEF